MGNKNDRIERLREAASDLDADEFPGALDRMMGKPDLTKKPEADEKPKLAKK